MIVCGATPFADQQYKGHLDTTACLLLHQTEKQLQ
jgi:hypothetical protein